MRYTEAALRMVWEEWNTTLRSRSVAEFVLMLKLGRRSLPW